MSRRLMKSLEDLYMHYDGTVSIFMHSHEQRFWQSSSDGHVYLASAVAVCVQHVPASILTCMQTKHIA